MAISTLRRVYFSLGVKKATQELYGLINYGELRKKIGGTLDERKAQKLQELIRKGSTSVRVKGKSVSCQNPICRALKKLNQIEENRENAVLRVPTSIVVEVVPASMHAWCRVQGLAHNPRVRVTSPLQRPVAVLISHLQEKWRSSNLKLCETLSSRVTFPLKLQTVTEPVLRLTPATGYVVKPINVQPEVLLKSSCVSLSSHEARLRRRGEKVGRSNKRKENKQQQEKEVEDREGATRDIEGMGVDLMNGDGERNDIGGLRDTEEKCHDVEVMGGDMEDFGEVSQEEHEYCSDGEAGCLNSPDGEADELARLSPEKHSDAMNNPFTMQVKEEPMDSDAMVSSAGEELDPDIQVKEESEGESGDTLRQLLALETVANAGQADDDAEVVCTGESTRLTAHVGDIQRVVNSSVTQVATEDDRGLAATPEPEEEDRNPSAEADEGTEHDIEAKLQKIRDGLTLNTVGGITIGELYLMFGQNKKICLEYEFEDHVFEAMDNSSSIAKSSDVDVESPTRICNTPGPSEVVTKQTTTDSGTYVVPGAGMAAVLTADSENSNQNKKKENATSADLDLIQNKEERKCPDVPVLKEKHATVENLSGMLAQLVAMAKMILTKSSTESCLCGHICGRPGNAMRSPASGRCQGILSFGRSPGNSRSPRTGKVATASGHSPRSGKLPIVGGQASVMASPGSQTASSAGLCPLPAKPLRDRNKPTSAKRLIPELPDPPLTVRDGRTGEGSTGNRGDLGVSFLTTAASTSIPVIETTTISTSQDTCQLSTPDASAGSPSSVTGLRVLLGGVGEAGEFKVPIGPAPRQVHAQQASFNAQLSKLLPRYNSRPGRRVVRKNVVVQRQLPLLPNTVIQPPGVVTFKVLQSASHDKVQNFEGGGNSGFIPITIAPSPHGVAASVGVFTSARPQPLTVSSTHSVRNPLIQPLQPQVSQVVASQVQLSVVPQNLQQAPPATPPLPAAANAISVNISGQPLMTVEMPASVPTSNIRDSTNQPSSDLSKIANSATVANVTTTVTAAPVTTVKSTNSVNGLLSSVVSQVFGELPDLSTPPGTPLPNHSRKSPNGSGSVNFASSVGSTGSSVISTAAPCPQMPSPSLFNSALSVEPLPSLSNEMMTNNSLVTALPPSLTSTLPPCLSLPSSLPTPCVSATHSPISTLLTPASTHHLELSPPPSQTNSYISLLNTPTPHSSDNVPSTPICSLSPTPSISSLLSSSSPPDLSKSFSTILASSDQDNSSLVSAATVNVPELHIPEGSVNLPLLDISLGGTVTIRDQTANLLSTDPDATLGMDLASTTATSTPVKSSPVTSTMICINPLQETSSDKLLDITLGISNSNSSFSSLLAAATQPRCLDSSLLDIPSMEGDGNNERVNGADAGNMSAVGIPSFPALSTTPPSPPSSPSRLLQQSDNQWLNSEVNDFSLSSFLGHFESPVKSSNSRGPSQTTPSGSFVPSLSSVYNENSVDFTATFAEMKAQVSGVFKQ
ncbi:LOW QUALITY PROTEIN: mucin-17 [Cherax quadricarinatus]